MLKQFTTSLILLFSFTSYAQFTSPSVTLIHDQNASSKKHSKAVNHPTKCGTDTLDYGYEKLISQLYVWGTGSSLRAINISDGYRLGQFYTTPTDITVSGFKFYGWALDTTANPVSVFCEVYEAGPDSLPLGKPVRADTLLIDTTFGGGVLDNIAQYANFQPYTFSKPFIVVVRSTDSVRVAIVTNDYLKKDGFGENFACGSIGGRWYRCLDLNISGNTLDCDMLLEPFVSYEAYNDFKLTDCYDYKDSVHFENTSSPIYSNQQYNIYKLYEEFRGYDYEKNSHRWSYGTGFYYPKIDGGTKFNTPRNIDIGLRSIVYPLTGYNYCVDTTIKRLSFQPDKITFSGSLEMCSGNKSSILASTTAPVTWYDSPLDTNAVYYGPVYESANALEINDTLYAKATNESCETKRAKVVVHVTKTPDMPTIKDDSICLNSMANLVANSTVGETKWYVDSTTLVSVHTGNFLQIGPLSKDTFFFAKSINGKCTHDGRVRVKAYVSNAFAPTEPKVSNDTTICLLDGSITLVAKGDNTLRWFDVAAGGNPIHTGDTLQFDPADRGDHYRYVDAYNGICPSSRLPIHVKVNHFPKLPVVEDKEACRGEDILVEYDNVIGDIRWYDSEKNGNLITQGVSVLFANINNSETYYLEPHEGSCRDTMRHKWSYTSIPYGKVLSTTLDTQACDLHIPNLKVTSDVGDIVWYEEDATTEKFRGSELIVDPIESDLNYWYHIDNQGCKTELIPHKVYWRVMPDANFDYQVNWRDVTFASRLIDQGDYIWDFDDNTDTLMGTDVSYHYYKDGTYNVSLIVQSPFDCIDTVTKPVTVNTVGIAPIEAGMAMLYPNPNNGKMFIELPENGNYPEVSLTDQAGRVLCQKQMTSRKELIDWKEYGISNGMYFVTLTHGTQLQVFPIVIGK